MRKLGQFFTNIGWIAFVPKDESPTRQVGVCGAKRVVGLGNFDALPLQEGNKIGDALWILARNQIKLSFQFFQCRFEELPVIPQSGFAPTVSPGFRGAR